MNFFCVAQFVDFVIQGYTVKLSDSNLRNTYAEDEFEKEVNDFSF